ncbi:hypothetical protein HUJ04_002705 [Dendroctonus ponderosae]|uniref:CUB domain-containing protein n=1 Tax=Dendroctonus ponderosae TaxID=77166 RepID=A0AAR5PGF7_DENPD|nr:hypothetical protein HUJ04_002705 [Dendroctonus ponderosae]
MKFFPCFLVFYSTILIKNNVKAESLASKELEDSHCGHVFSDEKFLIFSDNFPQPYPAGKECFYLLKGRNCPAQFNIQFLDFDLTVSIGCVKDRLEIGSQDAICGSRNGSKVYHSENGDLKLKFVADDEPETGKRGFRLLVSRSECQQDHDSSETVGSKLDDTTQPVQFEWTSNQTPIKPKPTYLPPLSKPCCLNNIFSSRTFLLVSPNFPYSINTPKTCEYIIRKSSSSVCRLRINVQFFALGPPGHNSCPYGHLEIDGKFLCGCNSPAQLTTSFGGLESKLIKFHTGGFSSRDKSGFVLEVIQDECQKSSQPNESEKFTFYEEQANRVSWPQNSNIYQLPLLKQRSYYLPAAGNKIDRQAGSVAKHFYFFGPADDEDTTWTKSSQEREETDSVDLAEVTRVLTNSDSYQQCLSWNYNQLAALQLARLAQMCQSGQQTTNDQIDSHKCLVLSSLTGSITSPGYPAAYPKNGNFCYRLRMLPGFCSVQVFFKDFDVESSYECFKDYLKINEYRYCGQYLNKKQVRIATNSKQYQDLNFVSDSNNCRRGFTAFYQQVQCENFEGNSVLPPKCNPDPRKANEDPAKCEKVISEKYFVIRNEMEVNLCSYDVTKYSENACKIQLDFQIFDWPCTTGTFTVNGREFCGQRFGQAVTMDILEGITIVYGQHENYYKPQNQFEVHGEQIECDNTPDPVRLISTKRPELLTATSSSAAKSTDNAYPDVCALIGSVPLRQLPLKICEVLTKQYNATDCNYSSAIILNEQSSAPSGTKILLSNKNPEKINYKEIEC